jgi:hypothetical protein
LIVSLLVLVPSPSSGAEPISPYRIALTEALAAKDRALDSGKVEDWTRTLELLRRADAIQTAAVTKYEIALAASRLGQVDVALENYDAANVLGLPDKASERAQEYIISHLAQVAQLQIEGPAETLILVRGVERGRLPLTRFVYIGPGTVELEAILPDARRVERTLQLTAGQIARTVIEAEEPESAVVNTALALDAAVSKEAERDDARINPATSPPRGRMASTSTPGRRHSDLRHVGWALAASGATMAALSVAFMPIAYSRISSSRDALRNACEVQEGNLDNCAHSKQGRWEEAQSASNAVATWRMARTVSWVGLVTGLAVTLGGTAVVLRAGPRDERPLATMQLSLNAHELQISYAAEVW